MPSTEPDSRDTRIRALREALILISKASGPGSPAAMRERASRALDADDNADRATLRGYYTITRADAGRSILEAFGKKWAVADFMGRILPGDAGKRVYPVPMNDGSGFILQVENGAQRDARLSRAGGSPS